MRQWVSSSACSLAAAGSRHTLAAALRRDLPDWRFRIPQGGLSMWVRLPIAMPLG